MQYFSQIIMEKAPTELKHITTKEYVDGELSTLEGNLEAYVDLKFSQKVKDAVRVVSVEDIAGTYAAGVLTVTATGILTIDGVATALNDRILLAGQTDGTENGIYVVTTEGATGVAAVLTRATDLDAQEDVVPNFIVPVREGTAYADNRMQLLNDGEIVFGTTALNFGPSVYIPVAHIAEGTITGDDVETVFTTTNTFNSKTVLVQIYDEDDKQVGMDIAVAADNITISTDVALATGSAYRVVVVG